MKKRRFGSIDRKSVVGFISGIMVTVLFMAFILPVAAATVQEIKVSMGGIKIYVDGNVKVPTDVNGNVVEPMIYNGTTYLPVRALTGMLTDKEVTWDGNAQTVYIGKKPMAASTPLHELTKYSGYNILTGKDAQFSILDQTISPFNAFHYFRECTYIINSSYSSINGEFVVSYTDLGSTRQQTLEIYSVDQYGAETLLDSYTAKAGDDPITVNTSLWGVNILKITVDGSDGVFYNITLAGAN